MNIAANWKAIGLPRWYDCKLGRINDAELARLVGATKSQIRYRRLLFRIPPMWSIDGLIAPFQDLLGVESDRYIADRCGASASSVMAYREALGIPPKPRPKAKKPRRPVIPTTHPARPYRALLGLVCDKEIAKLADCTPAAVKGLRKLLDLEEAPPLPELPKPVQLPNYQGPWLGYESLFGTMSAAKVSRAAGVPFAVVERRQEFLGVKPFQRVSRVARYEHLLGVVPHSVLAKLVGLTASRIAEMCRQKNSEQKPQAE